MREPNVVRVHMRDQHAQDGQAFELRGKDGFPLRLGFVPADAAVHHGPAGAAIQFVAQQP
jgi:hypothetical protein